MSNAKEALINSKIEKVLAVTYLSDIVNWKLAKGETKRLQAIFVDSEYHTKPSLVAFAFITRNITDLISFTVTLLDGKRKKLTFPSNKKKFQQLVLELKLQDRKTSRKMNDDKAAEKINNLFAHFKILGTKVNNDNKNRKKKLEEIKKILEAYKQDYQKLFYQHVTLKTKYCELEQKLKIKNENRENEKANITLLMKTITNKIKKVTLPLTKLKLKLIPMIMMTMMMMIMIKQ